MLSRLAIPRAVRAFVLAPALVALTVIAVRLALRPSSDLLNHREFGRRFMVGAYLYEGGLDYPYLPAWAAAHAPLALVPAQMVSVFVLIFGVSALIALLWQLERVSRSTLPLDDTRTWLVAAATVVLVSRFVIRDLLDGGENLVLTALAWSALFAWLRQRLWTGAWLLGAAIALKLTASVFLVALLARRRYACAAATVGCATVLTALPAVRMGLESYGQHLQHWAGGVRAGVASHDPSVGVLGREPAGNLSLRPALGRLLVDDQSSAEWRQTAESIAAAVILAVTVTLCLMLWRLRTRGELGDAVAWAAAGVLGLLISPISWRSHVVAILPASYLLVRRWVADGRLFGEGIIGLGALAVPGLLLARGVVGEDVSDWSDSWSLTTAALVCLAIGIARWPTRL